MLRPYLLLLPVSLSLSNEGQFAMKQGAMLLLEKILAQVRDILAVFWLEMICPCEVACAVWLAHAELMPCIAMAMASEIWLKE